MDWIQSKSKKVQEKCKRNGEKESLEDLRVFNCKKSDS